MLAVDVGIIGLIVVIAIFVNLIKYSRNHGELINIIIKCIGCAIAIGYILGGGFIETMYILVFFLVTGILDFVNYLVFK